MNTYEIIFYNKSTRLFGRVQILAKTKTKAVDLWLDTKFTSEEFFEIKLIDKVK